MKINLHRESFSRDIQSHPRHAGVVRGGIAIVLTLAGSALVPSLPATAATSVAAPLDPAAILSGQGIAEPGWYQDNIPFIDTPDTSMNAVYYYRWSTYKRALRSLVPGSGSVSTEYDVPIWYANNPYSALVDAAGYHVLDGRWAADQSLAGDTLDFWLSGAGATGTTQFSEWLIDAAYQRALVTGDQTDLVRRLPALIALYNRWSDRLDANITVNGQASTSSLYWQSPVSDATEFTETSLKSADGFRGGAGYRPTINSYMFAAATAISKIASTAGDTATASDYANKAASIKASVQKSLWDPQRQFFFQVYNQQDGSNGSLKGTRTQWRELMGYAPWAFNLPDSDYSAAWQYLMRPENFGAQYGPTTLERFQDFEAEQATVVHANQFSSSSASNGAYIGQIDYADSKVSFEVDSPGAGTFPVRVYYANATSATSTHLLSVNGGNPITVSYPVTGRWGSFSANQYVTVNVPLNAGANTLSFARGSGYAELDKITVNPYFNWDAIPAQQNRDDANCCHWNGPSWPYQTSQVLTGMANLLQSYPAQSYVSAADYRTILGRFTQQQFKDGKPYVAEAADGDTGKWIYDAVNFSDNYNHSSYIDLVLTGLFGIKPQTGNALVLKPLVSPDWDHFAVQNITYHGHKLSIVYDRDGSHYGGPTGLRVYQDGSQIYSSTAVGTATITIGDTVQPTAKTRLVNVAANPLSMDQSWLGQTITQRYPEAFATYTNQTANGPRCSSGLGCATSYDQPMRATDGWIRYDKTPDDRWTNVGSSNATDALGVDFGFVRPIQQLSIYTYDDGDTVRVPASYDVQYWNGNAWVSAPGQSRSPATPKANDLNTVTFSRVSTSSVRVVFTPQLGKYVGVTELQSWYPQAPTATITNVNSGLQLTGASGALPYGVVATQQAASFDRSHQWDLVPDENGLYKIVNVASGFVLGIDGASREQGAAGLLWVDNLTRDHLWSIVPAGNGMVKFVNANSGLLLGINGASNSVGATSLQWGDNGTTDHLWKLAPVEGGTYPDTPF